MAYPMTSDAIEQSIRNLENAFPKLCKRSAFPNLTNSTGLPARQYSFLRIGKGSGVNRPSAAIMAGIHAREYAQPDASLTFAGKLLQAYPSSPFIVPSFTDAVGTVHGPVTVDAGTVKTIIERMDIYLVPLANPDGRAFCMTADPIHRWRKNRAPSIPPGNAAKVGVDPNRNFDIAWDYKTYFEAAAFAPTTNFAHSTSDDPTKEVYRGPSAFSEPEAKNIKWLLDSFPIRFFLDLHSYAQKVEFPWSIETNQTTDASKNFLNATFDHQRDGELGSAYEEYFPDTAPDRQFTRHKTIAQAIQTSINSATGENYGVQQEAQLYPCTGTSCSYAFSRQFPDKPKMTSFIIEFGSIDENFQPSTAQYSKIEREIHAAMITFLKEIAVWQGLFRQIVDPPLERDCFIATAALHPGHPDLTFLRAWRDLMRVKPATRSWMVGFENWYYRFSPAVASCIKPHRTLRWAVRNGLVRPAAAVLRRLSPEVSKHGH